MKEALEARLFISNLLIEKLENEAKDLESLTLEELGEIADRAYFVKLKMIMFAERAGKPPEMLEQIERIDSFIKKAERMQNKQC